MFQVTVYVSQDKYLYTYICLLVTETEVYFVIFMDYNFFVII